MNEFQKIGEVNLAREMAEGIDVEQWGSRTVLQDRANKLAAAAGRVCGALAKLQLAEQGTDENKDPLSPSAFAIANSGPLRDHLADAYLALDALCSQICAVEPIAAVLASFSHDLETFNDLETWLTLDRLEINFSSAAALGLSLDHTVATLIQHLRPGIESDEPGSISRHGIASVVAQLGKIAFKYQINLRDAVTRKFNYVSQSRGYEQNITWEES